MTRDKPTPGILLTLAALVGGVIVLLVGGYVGGSLIYERTGGSDRAGFDTWCAVYRPVLFLRSANPKGYRYSDLNQDQWVPVTLESIDEQVFSKEGWMLSHFRRADGSRVSGFLLWIPKYDLIPKIGGHYRIKIHVSIKNDAIIRRLFGGDDPLQWRVDDDIVDVVEVAAAAPAADP